MGSQPLSRLLLLAAIGAAIFGCAGAARVASVSREPAVEIMNASGTLEVANSRAGQAIFQATGLAPGRSVDGTVQLSNTGTLAGELAVAQLDVQDQPGPHGGLLSTGVQLAVQDITGGSSIPVFSGQLGGLGSRSLGSIAPGEARTYRFTASLPNSGTPAGPTAGDNAYEGSGVTVRYVWTATAGDTGGVPVAPVVRIKVSTKQLLRRGVLDVTTTCDIACRVSTYAQLPKGSAPAGPRRRARAPLCSALPVRPPASA